MKNFIARLIVPACLIFIVLMMGCAQAEETSDVLSNYGYLSSTNANFRTKPNIKSERIAKLREYALMKVLGFETIDNATWYHVIFNGTEGYMNGNYFHHMTVGEALAFIESAEYVEGLKKNNLEAYTDEIIVLPFVVKQSTESQSNQEIEPLATIEPEYMPEEENQNTILFRNIPWFSNVPSTLTALGVYDRDEIDSTEGLDFNNVFVVGQPTSYGFGSLRLENWKAYKNVCCMAGSAKNSIKWDVAGYETSMVNLYFMYAVEDGMVTTDKNKAQFISGIYNLIADDYPAAYDDLRDKLTWLYGDPAVDHEKPHGESEVRREKYAQWNDENDASILLYVKYFTDDRSKEEYELSIEYARTDIASSLAEVEKLQETAARDQKYNEENTNGL